MGFTDRLKKYFLKRKRRFRLFQIEPTMSCNLRCRMCPWMNFHTGASSLEWETFLRIAAHFPEVEHVDFTGGGEPLLHPRLDDMIRIAKDAGCTVGFSTNATLLSREKAGALVDAGLDWIAYSVDGAIKETYERVRVGASFDQVIRNVESIRELREKVGQGKPRTMLFFVMMQENIHELPGMIELAHSLGIDHVVAKNLDVILKPSDDAQRIFRHEGEGSIDPVVTLAIQQAEEKSDALKVPLKVYGLLPYEKSICEQDPLRTLFVAADGSVSPCISLSYIQDRRFGGQWHHSSVVRFGNVAEEALETIWENPEYVGFRAQFQERISCRVRNLILAPAGSRQRSEPNKGLPRARSVIISTESKDDPRFTSPNFQERGLSQLSWARTR